MRMWTPGNIPSVSIAAVRKGRVIWEQSFGWADREKHIKASPDTVYEGLANDVTVKRLLHHTAGLPGHFNYFYRIGLVLRGNSSWRPGGLA